LKFKFEKVGKSRRVQLFVQADNSSSEGSSQGNPDLFEKYLKYVWMMQIILRRRVPRLENFSPDNSSPKTFFGKTNNSSPGVLRPDFSCPESFTLEINFSSLFIIRAKNIPGINNYPGKKLSG
jgi:hypothetical protein